MIKENFNAFKEVIETELEKIELNEARLNGIDYIKEIAGIGNKYGLINHVYAQNELNTDAVDNALDILKGDD